MNFRHLVSKTQDKINAFRQDDDAVALLKFAGAIILQAMVWSVLFNIAMYFNLIVLSLIAYLAGTLYISVSLGYLASAICEYAVAPQRKFTVINGGKS